jgi:hypothetical protein
MQLVCEDGGLRSGFILLLKTFLSMFQENCRFCLLQKLISLCPFRHLKGDTCGGGGGGGGGVVVVV